MLAGIKGEISACGFDFDGVFVFVESPSGDVELMDALVAYFAAAIIPEPVPIVVEAVFVEGPLRGRAEPEVVMNALRHRGVGIPADRFARFKAKASGHINLADTAVVEEFYGVDYRGDGTVLETCLNDSIIFSGGFEYFPAFPDIVRAGLFDVNVFAGLTGPYCGEGVPMVGRGDSYRIYIFVIKCPAEVIFRRRREILDFADLLYTLCEKIFVNVNESFDTNVGNFGKPACKFDTAAANADDGETDAFICADYAACSRGDDLGTAAGGKRTGGGNAGS